MRVINNPRFRVTGSMLYGAMNLAIEDAVTGLSTGPRGDLFLLACAALLRTAFVMNPVKDTTDIGYEFKPTGEYAILVASGQVKRYGCVYSPVVSICAVGPRSGSLTGVNSTLVECQCYEMSAASASAVTNRPLYLTNFEAYYDSLPDADKPQALREAAASDFRDIAAALSIGPRHNLAASDNDLGDPYVTFNPNGRTADDPDFQTLEYPTWYYNTFCAPLTLGIFSEGQTLVADVIPTADGFVPIAVDYQEVLKTVFAQAVGAICATRTPYIYEHDGRVYCNIPTYPVYTVERKSHAEGAVLDPSSYAKVYVLPDAGDASQCGICLLSQLVDSCEEALRIIQRAEIQYSRLVVKQVVVTQEQLSTQLASISSSMARSSDLSGITNALASISSTMATALQLTTVQNSMATQSDVTAIRGDIAELPHQEPQQVTNTENLLVIMQTLLSLYKKKAGSSNYQKLLDQLRKLTVPSDPQAIPGTPLTNLDPSLLETAISNIS